MKDRIIVQLIDHTNGSQRDLSLDANISAYELFAGLNSALGWGCDVTDNSVCYLAAENPVALLRGSASLRELGLRDGSTLHYTGRGKDR